MTEILIKGILFVCGCIFICGLCYLMISDKKPNKKDDETPDIRELYGTLWSIQFWSMISILVFFTFSLFVDLFFFPALDKIVGDLSVLPLSTIETYFSSLVTFIIGFMGVIAIALSILYGAHISKGTSSQERKKLGWQRNIWLLFSLYFIFTMVFLFVLPLIERLGSFR